MENKQYLAAMSDYYKHMAEASEARAKAEELADRPRNAETYRARAKDYASNSEEYRLAAAA